MLLSSTTAEISTHSDAGQMPIHDEMGLALIAALLLDGLGGFAAEGPRKSCEEPEDGGSLPSSSDCSQTLVPCKGENIYFTDKL